MKTIDLSNTPWHYKAIKLAGLEWKLRMQPDSCTYAKLLGTAALKLIIWPLVAMFLLFMFGWLVTSFVTDVMAGMSLKASMDAFMANIGTYPEPIRGLMIIALLINLLLASVAVSLVIVFGLLALLAGLGKLDKYLSNGPEAEPSALTKLYRSWRDKYCVQLKLPAKQ